MVPQQPPTTPTPNSCTKRAWKRASSAGVRSYTALPPTLRGRPALGITMIVRVVVLPRWRTDSCIRSGPVAQLRPMTSTGSASSVVTAAAMSLPTSIVPVVSMVTVQKIGTSRPSSAIASRAALMAILTCRMSWQVSMFRQSTPPAIRPLQ